MTTFSTYDPETEKELHQLIKDDLGSLEEGLKLIQYEKRMELGIPDLLCVDSGGRLTIIEVKLSEDENVLFQGLRYYCDVDKWRFQLSEVLSSEEKITSDHPRVILIAKNFSDYVRKLCTLVTPTVDLFGYQVREDSTGKRGMVYHDIQLPIEEEISLEKIEIEDHKSYLTKESLKPIFEKLRDQMKNTYPGAVEEARKQYIGYYLNGRQFAAIQTQRKSLDLWAHKLDEDKRLLSYPSIRIKEPEDIINEEFMIIKNEIKESYKKLGGTIPEE